MCVAGHAYLNRIPSSVSHCVSRFRPLEPTTFSQAFSISSLDIWGLSACRSNGFECHKCLTLFLNSLVWHDSHCLHGRRKGRNRGAAFPRCQTMTPCCMLLSGFRLVGETGIDWNICISLLFSLLISKALMALVKKVVQWQVLRSSPPALCSVGRGLVR
ncbi:hypothetical protein ASPBRDRAFT_553268 [Aspergillus brasiliensis CBS 101740]|uniref:Uncharacterized protein n=1 Tax=Aspergillus brasiliensis (strain CBS 101740 / IMI 381727 / IBT 21946) TaxID=767769 RepID=A0A1L9UMD0_ASPBC|nr:hypothetical protein ASPBRDRAFT_553268 [Aspergillus brasiliensis CBS 101740]